MSETLNVEKRETTGTLRIRRLRQTGNIPAVLYGHGEGNMLITVSSKELGNVIRAGNQIVSLAGDASGSALIKDIQWDPMGSDVLHVDFTRVKAGETVEVTLNVELKGSAPGTKNGGTVRFLVQELEIECPADKLTDKLEVSINGLELDQSILASDIELPEGSKLKIEPDAVIVQCIVVEDASEGDSDEDGSAAEPEVIGRKKEDEEGNE